MACAVMLLSASVASAQNLLKPGQGLVGVPPPIEAEPPADPNVTQLPGVDVKGKRDPLSEADRKRKAQAKALPGLNSDGTRTRSTAEKAIDYYNSLEKDPNKLDSNTQEFLDKTVNTPNDNHARDYSPTVRRDGADYVDPIAATPK